MPSLERSVLTLPPIAESLEVFGGCEVEWRRKKLHNFKKQSRRLSDVPFTVNFVVVTASRQPQYWKPEMGTTESLGQQKVPFRIT